MTTAFRTLVIVIVLGGVLAGPLPARASSIERQNIVDLISLSEQILVGKVTSLTDGFENGLPYTEVTLALEETIRGQARGTYTFRQFGLLAPRKAPNGRTCAIVTPDGWPRYRAGEEVFLFLYKGASRTGFRTTVGLLQGKFTIENGSIRNGVDNDGLFQRAEVDTGFLSAGERKMFNKDRGPIPAEVFEAFVKKAVEDRWVEGRKLQHVR